MLATRPEGEVIPTTTMANSSLDKEIDIKPDLNSNTISSQTISPERSIVSPVSSQDSNDDHKRPFSDIQEETDSNRLLEMSDQPADRNDELVHRVAPKLQKTETTITERHPGENDLNVIDKEANEILDEIKKSINDAEISLQNTGEDDQNRKVILDLLDSLNKAKSLILKLNLNKNLFKFQITSELEQNNIEKQILLRNLETFQNNLNALVIDNNNLNDKNMKLIKYYKYLKYGKLKDLKLKNLSLSKELDSLKHNYNNNHHNGNSNTQSSSSSGRSSIAYLQLPGENRMLNTLGMLASQVLANEEPQQDKFLPPTFGSITSFRSQSGVSDSHDEEEE